MTIDPTAPKSEIIEKAKSLARKSKAFGIIAGLLLIALAGVLAVKGTPQQSQAVFEVGGQFLSVVFEDNKIGVVSSSVPVSVTVPSSTEIVSGTDINSFVDQK